MYQAQITKYSCNSKTFYYAQFPKYSQEPGNNAENVSDVGYAGNAVDDHPVWQTVQLGHVCDGTERFIIADTLYTGTGGVLDSEVTSQEMARYSENLHEALIVMQARYEGMICRAITKIEQWLRNPQDHIPFLDRDHMIKIQNLNSLKVQMLERCRDKRPIHTTYGE